MARKQVQSEIPSVVFTCGQCAHAYGFCMPAYDGKPIACRCEPHPEYLKMLSQTACKDFEKGTVSIPEKVTVFLSEDRHPEKASRKMVPLFRKGDKRPFKVVPVDEIPPGGIRMEDYENDC